MIPSVWRHEDQALLERLKDELLLQRLWEAQVGRGSSPPPRHAAGLIYHLRKAPGGEQAVSAAFGGNFTPLYAMLLPSRLDVQPPELLHHLSLHYQRIAGALEAAQPERAGGKPASDAIVEARVRSLAAWFALAAEGHYLRSLASTVAGSTLADAEIERIADEAPFLPLDDLGRIAREGARDRTPAAQAALAALSRAEQACRFAHSSPAFAKTVLRRAQRHCAGACEEALAPILEGVTEASARGHISAQALVPLLERAALVWQWAGQDEAVEEFAVDQLTPIAWEHYRAARWDDLRRLLGPVEPLVDSLARRIRADPSRIAYAGPCAQMFVFRSEVERTAERQWELAERSLEVCPTHRNGRLVVSNLLVDRAIDILAPAGRMTRERYETAACHIDRAEKLFPASKKLDEAKRKLAEAKRIAKISP